MQWRRMKRLIRGKKGRRRRRCKLLNKIKRNVVADMRKTCLNVVE
jgi:hypothetical protein